MMFSRKESELSFRVLGLACSPRRGGNTETMLDWVLSGAVESGAVVKKVIIPELKISPCRACNSCFREGMCVQDDDMQELYSDLTEYEGIVLAAPIFSMNLAAQAKVMIDRLQCFWARKYVLHERITENESRQKRKGLWLSAAGMKKEDVFEPARKTVKYFFAMLEISEFRSVTYCGVDEKKAIEKIPGAYEKCREAGNWLASWGG